MQRDGIVKPVERLIQAEAIAAAGWQKRKNAAIWGLDVGRETSVRRGIPVMQGRCRRSYSGTRSSFCKHRVARTAAGMSSSGKLVFQLVTPTSPT